MEKFESLHHYEKEPIKIESLRSFDRRYFNELEGESSWIALDQENCMNQQYFTVYGNKGEKLGVVGVYDTLDEKNVTHTVVDKKYRGQGLSVKFKKHLIDELNLPFITMTISLDNIASIKAALKLDGVEKVSDKQYENDFNKVKYIYKRPEKEMEE